ncbi:MAG: hypothetical protein HYU66_16905 [Armatimonadetes bacterium]|nr:hypothetical protein [Armatimonadota bacterium]
MRLLAIALLPLAAASAEVLIDTDFGQAGQPVNATTPDGNTDVTGSLPGGWFENSSGAWQPVIVIRYQPMEEAGRRFLRIQKRRGGNLQLGCNLPDLKTETFLRLTFTARTLGNGAPDFGIRFNGAPYSMPWQVSPSLTEQWQEYTFDFRLDAQPQAVRLQISHGGSGEFDLEQLRLERFSRDELIAQIKQQYPTAGDGNLAVTTRFPLGLPSGWFLDRDDDDATIRVTGDHATPGPSGSPALHVAAPGRFTLRSAPFAVPWSFEPHTVSLALRSARAGRLAVLGAGGRVLAARAFEPSPDFRRLSLTFQPVLRGEVHGLRVEGEGDLWLDALQVERGSQATDYKPAQACEVVLACPPSETAEARVQFDDEPAAVAWAVTGEPAAQLRLTVVNLYGQRHELPPIALGAEPLRQGVADFSAGAVPRYGQFRVEAQAVDAGGKPCSAPAEVVLSRLHRPRYWGQDAPQSPRSACTRWRPRGT